MAKNIVALAALSAALLTSTSSFGADLPARIAPVPAPIAPQFSWTGFYAGVNAGYAFGTGRKSGETIAFPANADDRGAGFTNTNPLFGGFGTPINNWTLPSTLAFPAHRPDGDGFAGGGQIGYNYQLTPGSGIVVGFEADAQYADLGRSRGNDALTFSAGANPVFIGPPLFSSPVDFNRDELGAPAKDTLRSVTLVNADAAAGRIAWFGTVRGRLGYAIDRVLFYGTGGFAYGESDQARGSGRHTGLLTGWAAGGGIEYALPIDSWLNVFHSNAVTLKIEGLYVSLDRARSANVLYARDQNGYGYYAPANLVSGLSRSSEFAVVRVGLNYKF